MGGDGGGAGTGKLTPGRLSPTPVDGPPPLVWWPSTGRAPGGQGRRPGVTGVRRGIKGVRRGSHGRREMSRRLVAWTDDSSRAVPYFGIAEVRNSAAILPHGTVTSRAFGDPVMASVTPRGVSRDPATPRYPAASPVTFRPFPPRRTCHGCRATSQSRGRAGIRWQSATHRSTPSLGRAPRQSTVPRHPPPSSVHCPSPPRVPRQSAETPPFARPHP